jgi:hypothetical protein
LAQGEIANESEPPELIRQIRKSISEVKGGSFPFQLQTLAGGGNKAALILAVGNRPHYEFRAF